METESPGEGCGDVDNQHLWDDGLQLDAAIPQVLVSSGLGGSWETAARPKDPPYFVLPVPSLRQPRGGSELSPSFFRRSILGRVRAGVFDCPTGCVCDEYDRRFVPLESGQEWIV
jgi:hypothetical protein